MATKWKNTVKTIRERIRKNAAVIGGSAVGLAGAALLWNVVADRGWHPTEEAVFFGILGNLFLALGLYRLIREYFLRKCPEGPAENEGGFQAWRETRRHWNRRLMIAGAAALLLAFWYLIYLTNGGVYMSIGPHVNYASGYLMIFSALLQYLVCREALERIFQKRLDDLTGAMEEINKRRLEEALEIERKSLEKVSRSDQLRVDLITNVSHDLKTPLTSMVGYLELIKKEELSGVVRDYVDVISERAEKLKEMINSLFSLAKASSGNIELHPEKFEVNRLIGQIFADMDDQIRNSGLTFVKSLTEEDTELLSDNSYFYRICQNLVENALKYSAKGTRVFVKTGVLGEGRERAVRIEITNTAGYPMDFDKEDIVERFARGDKARSGDGNGLGLAIVSTYAKALGGEFDIHIDCDQFKACLIFPAEDKK